jgi:phosphatidylinositol-3-phosphatase
MVFPRIWALVVGIVALTVAGCSGGGISVNTGNGAVAPSIPQVQHVVIITLENANFDDVIGTQNMPFLTTVLTKGALAAKYFANSHPSTPNYFTMTTGLAITNDDNFNGIVTDDNVARELSAAGKTWKVYAESIPSQGYVGGDQGLYLRHHNPFSFFSDVRQSSFFAGNIVQFSQFSTDLSSGHIPNYSFIIPNAEDDAHSCPDGSLTNCTLSSRLQTADQWLQSNISPLLGDSSFQQSGLLVITFDESANDSTNGGGHVVTILLGTHVKPGYTGNTTSYDHRSLLSLSMKALGVFSIPNGAGAAPQMTEFFR